MRHFGKCYYLRVKQKIIDIRLNVVKIGVQCSINTHMAKYIPVAAILTGVLFLLVLSATAIINPETQHVIGEAMLANPVVYY